MTSPADRTLTPAQERLMLGMVGMLKRRMLHPVVGSPACLGCQRRTAFTLSHGWHGTGIRTTVGGVST